MKYQAIISLALLPLITPALGAAVTIPNDDSAGLQKRNLKGSIRNKLSQVGNEKAKVFKVAGKGVKVAEKGVKAAGKGAGVAGNKIKFVGGKGIKATGKGVKVVGQGLKHVEGEVQKTFKSVADDEAYYEIFNELGDIIPTCAREDCRNTHFMNEAMRWVKQAVNDVGVVMHDNPAATTALIIGVSILMAELISGGMLVPVALRAVGFGPKGPIKNTIAAAVQRVINPIKLGSAFARFQSAAMKGAAIGELKKIAHSAINALIGVGVVGLVGGGVPQGHMVSLQEWKTWELESRVDVLSNFTSNATQLWGTPTYTGCVAYGYQKISAPLSLIPEDIDSLDACAQTPAVINGIGFKTPLDCVDEGSEKGAVGMWYVSTNSTECMPWWNKVEDEGCMLYGRRRKFARLMGLKKNDDWKSICESTPAIIDDKHYDQPSHCDDKGVLGIYGVFNIEDKQCECACAHS